MMTLTLPIMLYHIFWVEKPEKSNILSRRRWVTLICALAALFCMTHPYTIIAGYHYDLRLIPLLVAFLYGGFEAGFIVAAIILAIRYYIGGPGFLLSVLSCTVVLPIIVSCISLCKWKDRAPKLMFPGLLTLLATLVFFCVAVVNRMILDIALNGTFFVVFGFYCLIHMLTMIIVTFLIERSKEVSTIRQEIQQTEKLNVLSELAASVAHEIRNPLTVARGFMQILSQTEATEEKKQMYTAMVIDEIDRAQSIITDYLAFAKPQAEKMERVDASALSDKLMNLISSYASMRGVEIKLNLESALWIVVNSDKFIQCLVNLIKNGIEAMPEGGTLRINGYKTSTHICVEIMDHGIGMSAEQMERLGTPFYSTRDKGTGLGMMVSYRIIKTFGGCIKVKSEINKGTCITILLPIAS